MRRGVPSKFVWTGTPSLSPETEGYCKSLQPIAKIINLDTAAHRARVDATVE
jgi:hypothetical protein